MNDDRTSRAGETPRAAAARILGLWLDHRAFPDLEIERIRQGRAFVMETVYGTLRHLSELDWMLGRLSRRMPDPRIHALLLTALYQVFHLDRADAFAVVHDSVELARAAEPRAAGFVNAILRESLREMDSLRRELSAQPPDIRESHPRPLLDRWTRRFGLRDALRLCAWNNGRPDVSVRFDLRRGLPSERLAQWANAGIRAEPHPFDPQRFAILPRGAAPAELPGFAEGGLVVQDPATAVSVDLLDPRPDEAVWDVCAAPGGKTLHLAEKMDGRGVLWATDKHADRLFVLRENVARAGLDAFVTVAVLNPAAPGSARVRAPAEAFDAILLDVPCSNTGVLRRRPDARWNFNLGRLARLTQEQSALLDAAAARLKPGGRIVYSTCSLEPEEDEDLIAAWTARHPEFRLRTSRKLFPPDTRTDGAYAARLEKAGTGLRE